MNAALMQKIIQTNAGTEITLGIRPYRSSRVTLTYDAIMVLCKEQGFPEDKLTNLHIWLYNLMSYVADVEFPKKTKGITDPELEGFREYWSNANGDVAHNYELLIDVSEDVSRSISNTVRATIKEYKDSFPKMPEIIQEGKPDDPNVSRAGGTQSKKKS